VSANFTELLSLRSRNIYKPLGRFTIFRLARFLQIDVCVVVNFLKSGMNKKYFLGLGLAGFVAMTSAANAASIIGEAMTPGTDLVYGGETMLGSDEDMGPGDGPVGHDRVSDPGQLVTSESSTVTARIASPGSDAVDGPSAAVTAAGSGAGPIVPGPVDAAVTSLTMQTNPEDAGSTTVTAPGMTWASRPIPEPASWLMMICGFTLVGFNARRRRRMTVAA